MERSEVCMLIEVTNFKTWLLDFLLCLIVDVARWTITTTCKIIGIAFLLYHLNGYFVTYAPEEWQIRSKGMVKSYQK
jgi:hypothetical protein